MKVIVCNFCHDIIQKENNSEIIISGKLYDLCPNCMSSMQKYIKEHLYTDKKIYKNEIKNHIEKYKEKSQPNKKEDNQTITHTNPGEGPKRPNKLDSDNIESSIKEIVDNSEKIKSNNPGRPGSKIAQMEDYGVEKIAKMYFEGCSIDYLAEFFNSNKSTIVNFLRKYNIRKRHYNKKQNKESSESSKEDD